MRLKAPSYKNQAGSVLLEALISVAIFVVGVLGIMQLSGTLVKQTTESKYRTDASFFAQEAVGRMWADRANIASYGTATYAPRVAIANKITGALPNGGLDITLAPSATKTDARIAVSWRQAGESQRQVVVVTTIAN